MYVGLSLWKIWGKVFILFTVLSIWYLWWKSYLGLISDSSPVFLRSLLLLRVPIVSPGLFSPSPTSYPSPHVYEVSRSYCSLKTVSSLGYSPRRKS